MTGCGCVTAAGAGVGALFGAWLAGGRAIRPVRRFDTSMLAVHVGGEMPDPAPGHAHRGAAHLDVALDEALAASGLPSGACVATVVATTKGFLDSGRTVAERGEAHGVGLPARWLAARVADRVGARRPDSGWFADPVTVSTACASGTSALALVAAAAPMISRQGIDAVIVAGVDLLSDFVFRGFAALHAMDSAPCRPFDRGRAGMTASEAAAVIVLEPESRARDRGANVLATLLGGGITNDAAHPTAPSRDGAGLARAIDCALRRAEVVAADLGHVHAHGTATVFNDAMEVRAFGTALGDAAALVPVTTLKGTVGHAFGAAGVVETIASIEAVRRGVVPGIAGLDDPEPGLRLLRAPADLRSPVFLKVNAGFGGFDAAVVVAGERG